MVCSDALENPVERARLYGVVVRSDFVVLAHLLGRYPDVRSFLARSLITQLSQRLDQNGPETSRGSFIGP